jgi:DNA adenine methylase
MIFRFPGGKKKVTKLILSKAPEEIEEYREPFVGGGSVFFAMPTNVKIWINDLDPYLMSVYFALRDRADEFITKCRSIDPQKPGEPLASARPGGKLLYNARLKEQFDKLAYDEAGDQALRYFFVNRVVWAGRIRYDIPSRMYFSNPSGWNIVKTKKLEQAAEKLKNAKITIDDYKILLSEPGKNVWCYCDPPYVINTNLAESSQLYRLGFTEDDHRQFRDAVKNSPHKVLISYDDNEFIRELFKGFNIYETSWKYSGTSSAEGCSKKKKIGKELLITNY